MSGEKKLHKYKIVTFSTEDHAGGTAGEGSDCKWYKGW